MMNKDTSEYINYTGGAYGVDTMGDTIGRKYGFNRHVHFRPYGNIRVSKRLRDRGTEPQVLSEELIAYGRDMINPLLGTNHKDNISGNLQGRNYYQVLFSDSIYCFSKVLDSKTIAGGTNTAFQLAINLSKNVHVYDLNTSRWYHYDYVSQELVGKPNSLTVVLSPKYAIVGTRDVEDYHVKDKKTGVWGSRLQYLGKDKEREVVGVINDLYKDTLYNI